MTTLSFVVPGPPEPQRRPRAAAINGRARLRDDPRNVTYAGRIREAWARAGHTNFGDEPVSVMVLAVFPRPKNHWTSKGQLSKAGRSATFCTNRIDVDNIAKAVCDALNAYAWIDDRQVVELAVRKEWAASPDTAGLLRVHARAVTTVDDAQVAA